MKQQQSASCTNTTNMVVDDCNGMECMAGAMKIYQQTERDTFIAALNLWIIAYTCTYKNIYFPHLRYPSSFMKMP
jgi:hypothetical protein